MATIAGSRETQQAVGGAFPPDHLAMRVSSFERCMPYYEALLPLLGFARESDHAWHSPSGFHLKFDEAEEGTLPYDRAAAGVNHVGFRAGARAELETIRDSMRAAGFEAPEILLLSGASALFMSDPDGFRFEISHLPEDL